MALNTVASPRYIEFDVNDIIDCEQFIEDCKTSFSSPIFIKKELNSNANSNANVNSNRNSNRNTNENDLMLYGTYYYIIIRIATIPYHCTVELPSEINDSLSFTIYFLRGHHPSPVHHVFGHTNTTTMMSLHVTDSYGIGSVLRTNFTNKPACTLIPGYNALQSLIYIRCFVYRMIGVQYYKIEDSATFSCDSSDEYRAFMYRVFATKPDHTPRYPIHELSIYYKFFNYRVYVNEQNDDEPIQLNNLSDDHPFERKIKKQYESVRKLTYPFTNGEQLITTYFASFTPKSVDCPTYASMQRSIHSTTMKYRKFEELMTNITVCNTDCIYYSDPFASPKKSPNKSPNKSRKSPNKSRKSPNKSRKSPNKSRKSPNKSRNKSRKSPNKP